MAVGRNYTLLNGSYQLLPGEKVVGRFEKRFAWLAIFIRKEKEYSWQMGVCPEWPALS